MATDPKDTTTPTTSLFVTQVAEEFRSLKTRINFLEQQAIRAPGVETLNALASAVTRANQLLGFNSLGQPVILGAPTGTAADVLLTFADATNAAQGAGAVGYTRDIAYAANTAGAALNSALQNLDALSAMTSNNVIDNGELTVNQVPSTTLLQPDNSTNAQYDRIMAYDGFPDRFCSMVYTAAGVGTPAGRMVMSQGSFVADGRTMISANLAVNTANASWPLYDHCSGVCQRITMIRMQALMGKPAKISFWFNTNKPGTYSLALRIGDLANGLGITQTWATTFTAVAGSQLITVSVPTIPVIAFSTSPANPYFGTLIIGALNTDKFQVSTAKVNAWSVGGNISCPGATNWADTAGNYIAVSEVQLLSGTYSGRIQQVDRAISLLRCYAWYYRMSSPPLTGVWTAATTAAHLRMTHLTEMITAPTVSFTDNVQTITDGSTVGSLGSILNNWSNQSSVDIDVSAASGSYGVGRPALVVRDGSGLSRTMVVSSRI